MTNDVTDKKVETPPNVTAAPKNPTTTDGKPTTSDTPVTAQTTQETSGYSTSENSAYGMGAQGAHGQQGNNPQADAVQSINQENRSGMAASTKDERKAQTNAGK